MCLELSSLIGVPYSNFIILKTVYNRKYYSYLQNNRSMLSTLPLTFVAIAETGSITLAADELDLAKSAVSQNLKRLEGQLGVKLATRTTRRFSLTPAGERYYVRCKEILALSKMASTEMEDFGATPSGPITVTAPHAMIAPVIAPVMSRIMQKHPGLRPSVIADDERLDLIAAGIDLSITVGDLADSSLRARKVGVLRNVLCVSPGLLDNPQSKSSPATIQAVQSLPYIAHSRERRSAEHRLKSLKSAKPLQLSFKPVLFGNTVEALVAFAREGLGVAMLPEYAVVNDLALGNLVRVFPDYCSEGKAIYAVHAYDDMPPKSVTEIITAVQAELKP